MRYARQSGTNWPRPANPYNSRFIPIATTRQRCRAYLVATAHVRLPLGIDRLMHNIMEHNAHHVNPRIPMFRLRGAQSLLRERQAGDVRVYRLGWTNYMDCVRRCKLYDFANHTWLDFRGGVTSHAEVAPPAG